MSSGLTQFSCFAFGIDLRFASVSIVLGAIALTSTLSLSTSSASEAVKVLIVPLAIAYAANSPAPSNPVRELTETIRPYLFFCITGTTARQHRKVGLRLR